MRFVPMIFLAVVALAAPGAQAWHAVAWTELPAGTEGSLCSCPCGDAYPFSQMRDSSSDSVAGIVHLQVLDDLDMPIPYMPREDIWLESSAGNLVHSLGGTLANVPTDADGYTMWADPLFAGGYSRDSEYLVFVVNGQPADTAPILPIRFNSPDITGDLVVNLSDLTLFASDYHFRDVYRSNFDWGDLIILGDLTIFAVHYTHSCP